MTPSLGTKRSSTRGTVACRPLVVVRQKRRQVLLAVTGGRDRRQCNVVASETRVDPRVDRRPRRRQSSLFEAKLFVGSWRVRSVCLAASHSGTWMAGPAGCLFWTSCRRPCCTVQYGTVLVHRRCNCKEKVADRDNPIDMIHETHRGPCKQAVDTSWCRADEDVRKEGTCAPDCPTRGPARESSTS